MQQLQQYQNYIVGAGLILAVLLAWWVLGKVRIVIGTFLAMPFGKKVTFVVLTIAAVYAVALCGVEPLQKPFAHYGYATTWGEVLDRAYVSVDRYYAFMDAHPWIYLGLMPALTLFFLVRKGEVR